jgi:3-phenylpropionate/trans-cinnamate dioxygenase ferredoxin reductase subunit
MTARIVIIGGGQAGGWAAKTLRDEGTARFAWWRKRMGFLRAPAAVESGVAGGRCALPRLFSAEAQQALNLTLVSPAACGDRSAK